MKPTILFHEQIRLLCIFQRLGTCVGGDKKMTDRKIRVACEHLSVVNISVVNISVLSVQDLTVPG